MSDLVILIIGYVVVNLLSLLIAARVRKHLSAFIARFTHLFIVLISLYYLVDLIILRRSILHDPYFYFWFFIILTQILILLIKLKRERDAQSDLNQLSANGKLPNATSEPPTTNSENDL